MKTLKISASVIENEILPHLSLAKRGYICSVELTQVIIAIFYKLKTGVQWRLLPVKQFIEKAYTWSGVYHHFRKWNIDGSLERLWETLLSKYKGRVDFSNGQLDGSHTPAKRGGEQVAYQGRKKSKTTNMLFISDSKGNMLSCSDPIAGNHNDLYKIEKHFEDMLKTLDKAGIATEGLFLNADAGFDSEGMRKICQARGIILNVAENKRNRNTESNSDHIFDEELYENRYVIERSNAWLDAFKTLLVRYETKAKHWKGWHYLAFCMNLLRNVNKNQKV